MRGRGAAGGGSTRAVLPCSFQADWSGELDGSVKLVPVGGALPQGVGRRRVSDRQVVWPGMRAFGPALMSVSKEAAGPFCLCRPLKGGSITFKTEQRKELD